MSVERWAYEGVVLNVDDKGQVALGDLKEFLGAVEHLGKDTPIRANEFGLRATRVDGAAGPRLDWRD